MPSVEKAETVPVEDGGCAGIEFGGGEDLGWELSRSGWSSCAAVWFLESGEEAGCLGAPKKDVMVAFAFGFFEVELAMSAAFRLRGVAIWAIKTKVRSR